jgi:hypothetical protein
MAKKFTTEARRTQRRQGERRFYIPLPFSILRFSVYSAPPWLFSFFVLQRLNLRDSNPVRGEMFIELAQPNFSSVGVTRGIAARNTYRSYLVDSWVVLRYKHFTPNGVQDIDFHTIYSINKRSAEVCSTSQIKSPLANLTPTLSPTETSAAFFMTSLDGCR